MIREDKFETKREDLWIRGNIFYPEQFTKELRKYPVVIICHGFGGGSCTEEDYCHFFASHGYLAVSFSFCGGGAKEVNFSDGIMAEMNLQTECEDLEAVLHYVQGLAQADAAHITLMGTSQGGMVSALFAARHKEEIEQLVLVCPAFCIPDDARRGHLGGADYQVTCVPEKILCPNGAVLGSHFHNLAANMDPFLEIPKYDKRVLIIHGTKDQIVDYTYALRAKSSYAPKQCELHLIREAGHAFTEEQKEQIMIAALHFMQGKKEQLEIQVVVTGYEVVEKREGFHKGVVYFTGYCDHEHFQGAILPGAKDTQTTIGEEPTRLYAEYTLEGMDYMGKNCQIQIVNKKEGEFFKPQIHTDSEALGYLNDMDCTAILEMHQGGLTVRIVG